MDVRWFVHLLWLMFTSTFSVFQLNPTISAFQRKFVSEVRRCDEMERKLRKSRLFYERSVCSTNVPSLRRLFYERSVCSTNVPSLRRLFYERSVCSTNVPSVLRTSRLFYERPVCSTNVPSLRALRALSTHTPNLQNAVFIVKS